MSRLRQDNRHACTSSPNGHACPLIGDRSDRPAHTARHASSSIRGGSRLPNPKLHHDPFVDGCFSDSPPSASVCCCLPGVESIAQTRPSTGIMSQRTVPAQIVMIMFSDAHIACADGVCCMPRME